MALIDLFRSREIKSPLPDSQRPQQSGLLDMIASLIGSRTFEFGGPRPTPTPNLPPRPTASPVPAATPTPTPTLTPVVPEMMDQAALEKIITAGLAGRGNPPIASEVPAFAEAGISLQEQNPQIDPLLPVILALMETGGGARTTDPSAFNPFNIFRPGTQDLGQFSSFRNSLFGENPGETLNLLGILRPGGPNAAFAESGDVSDLFRTFTPESDPRNPSNEELVRRFNLISQEFLGQ